jgi:hypothetical protein
MHLPPEIWGPMFWSTLHIISLAYPDDPTYAEKRAGKELFNALAQLLPCPVCRSHYKEILQANPVESWLDNRKSLVEWVWTMHNQVNIKLGKPEITMSDFYKIYNEMADRGLPIPPSNPHAEISDEAMSAAWVRGAATAAGTVAVLAAVGGLLWVSYKK